MLKKLVYILFILVTITSCQEKSVIKIGLIGDLTNKTSNVAESGKNGAILAVNHINLNGGIKGHKVELLVKNHENNKTKSYELVKELINSGVSVVIGPFLSSMAQSATVATINSNTLLISPTVSSDKLSGINDNFFRVIPFASHQGESLAYEINSSGVLKALIVVDDNNKEYTDAVYKGFTNKLDTQIQLDVLSLSGIFNTSVITEFILDKTPESIIFVTDGKTTSTILEFLNDTKIKKPNLYGCTWTLVSGIIDSSKGLAEGMILTDSFKNAQPSKKEKLFTASYQEMFNSDPTLASIYAYEGVIIYLEALENSKSNKTSVIKDYIINKKVFNGVSEDIIFNEFGDVTRKTSLYIIKNNQLELLIK